MQNLLSARTPIMRYGVWLLFGGILFLYLNLFRHALIDDAFITLRYVKTLLTSGTWGFFPGTIANSATSPLNVLLLAGVSLFLGPTVHAAVALYFIVLLFTSMLLVRLSSRLTGSELHGWLAGLALVFNPLLISTMGLESVLFGAFFVLAIYCFHMQRWTLLAIALGLQTLCRPEGALFFLVFLPFIPEHRTKFRLVMIYALSIAPWYLFSWIFLGSFVPDTFFIKTEQERWYQWDFFNGIPSLYYYVYSLGTILSFVFLPLAGLLFHQRIKKNPVLVIIWLAGLIHFVGYSALRVPPFHWYYAPQVVTIVLFGSLALGVLYQGSSAAWQKGLWGTVTALYFFIPFAGMTVLLARDGFVVREMPIHSNWGTHEQYRQVGLWLNEHHGTDTIRLVAGEIGTLAYYCDCRLLDRFSDRRWLRDHIDERVSRPGIISTLWRLNFAFYSPPDFPTDNYVLRAYFAEPDRNVEIIKEWRTSTTWIEEGFLLLSRE